MHNAMQMSSEIKELMLNLMRAKQASSISLDASLFIIPELQRLQEMQTARLSML